MGCKIIKVDFSFKKEKTLITHRAADRNLSQHFQAALKLCQRPWWLSFPCFLLSLSTAGASCSQAAVVTAFQLIPFVRGSISILDVLIFFFLDLEETFSSQLVHPSHFTDEKRAPQDM